MKAIKIILIFFIIVTILKISDSENLRKAHDFRTWESICQILSCKPILDRCIRNNCLGKDDCRNCVLSEYQMCVRCVDGLLDEQYFTINGAQTIICDPVNNIHLTTCNFYCRMKESLTWKCEQAGGYPLCNCEQELTTSTTTTQLPTTTTTAKTTTTTQLPTTTTTTQLPTTTTTPKTTTTTQLPTTTTTAKTTTTTRQSLGSLICMFCKN
jgi:hypothetical protein